MDTVMFAPIEKSLFKQDLPDYQTTINSIEQNKSYMSLK